MSTSRFARITLAAFLFVAASALAQSGGGFQLRRSTIDSGGGTSSANGLALTGTIGQPDAGFAAAGGFELRGGFWAARTEPSADDELFRNSFEDQPN